ncbi:MAG: ATP-dependent DNA helicase [Saprospiraceae bacterium]
MDTSRKSLLKQYNNAFKVAKSTLNKKQAEAVEQIYGPVMTVAGPGTGKTQLLAVRIGNILQQTDVNTSNILSLTYTNAGCISMRERLKQFIGPEAYNAKIFTFHSFCNYIIQENIQYFGGFRNLQLVSELELVDVFRELIDGFGDDHPLKRYKGNLYYETDRLKNLFNTLKQEGWSAELIESKVAELEDYYFEQNEMGDYVNPKYIVRGRQTGKDSGIVYTKGEINRDKVLQEIKGFAGLVEGAKELENYEKILARKERYDYNDMILWVIEAFKQNPDLLATYQERFQFLLIDEYQDTNGSQNELLFLLADNPIDDKPNIFIVGDDDQSIFRFQGANMNNIIDFANKYNPKEVVLDNNYRSYQGILDNSKMLIDNNQERLVSIRSHLTKNLIESRNNKEGKESFPNIFRFKNIPQEEIGIINDILEKNKNGVPFNQIAVIYKKHRNVENIVKYLTLAGVPLNIKRKINVLKEGEIKRLGNIIKYIIAEYKKPLGGEHFLFEIMHYEYFNISAQDIAMISIYCSNRTDSTEDDRRWRTVISDVASLKEAGVNNIESVIRFSDIVESWIKDIANNTAQILFEKILTNGGVLDHILASDQKVWRLQLVNTFFNFIKEESTKVENISMPQIIERIEKMESNDIEMPLNRIIFSENGIFFTSAHGSKGLEFDHVYIIKGDQKNWVTKTNYQRNYKFPPSLVPASERSDVEDDRRLFYVAMTRAKNDLTISYSDFNESEKALEPARFIEEITINENETTVVNVSDEDVLEYNAKLLTYNEGTPTLIEHDLIDNVLQNFKLSSTSLNKYLRCPLSFYFENILRVPMARGASNGFGNAIHYALELYFREMESNPERKLIGVDILQNYFLDGMKKYHSHFTPKEKELSHTRGKILINAYYEKYASTWTTPRKNEMEFDIKTECEGVPISGKLDRVAIFDDHLRVIDYKTGRYDSAKLKPSLGDEDNGGDYWRQMVFYKLLLQGDNRLDKPMKVGVMDFVEATKEGKFNLREFEVSNHEIETVKQQIKETYNHIKNHEFEEGCNEEHCTWCNFIHENMALQLPVLDEDDNEND